MSSQVAISLPARTEVCAHTVADIAEVLCLTRTVDLVYLNVVTGHTISQNRTILVHEAFKNPNLTHVMFIDSDMRFPHDALDRLLAHNEDIIGANYRWRSHPDNWASGVSSEGKTGIEQVHVIGFGVSLIRKEVFEDISEPWFSEPWLQPGSFMSDDVFFCGRARQKAHEIYVDHDLSQQVRHIGTIEYGVNL